jgi:ribosome-associated protein
MGRAAGVLPKYRTPCHTTASPHTGREALGAGEARFGDESQPRHARARHAAVRIRPMADESIRVTRSVSIPRSEIELRFSRSSGPGGQHAQKSDTRVEAVFDVEASSALSDAQKRRVLAKAGPVLRAVAQDERSQWRNRELALERLTDALREALRVQRRRRPTKPSQAAVDRRLEQKRRRGETKRLRRPPPE